MLRAAGLFAAGLAAAALAAPPAPARQAEKPYLGVSVKVHDDPKGFVVDGFLKDSPAAGVLKAGDVITKVDGKAFPDLAGLVGYVGGRKPGDVLAVTVVREKKEQEVKVTLARRPPPK